MALVDLVKIVINTTGTGALSLGAAVFGYRGREALTDGETYDYSIQQEAAWEYGRCTFLAATNQVIRTPIGSSNGGSPINIQAGASIAFTLLAESFTINADLALAEIAAATTSALGQIAAAGSALPPGSVADALGTATSVAPSQRAVAGGLALLNQSPTGAFWTAWSTSDFPAPPTLGANVQRLSDRLFIGAATATSGNFPATSKDYYEQFEADHTSGYGFRTSWAQFASGTTNGGIGVLGFSRTSDTKIGIPFQLGVGGWFATINDSTTTPCLATGLYGVAFRLPGAGQGVTGVGTVGGEVDICNLGNSVQVTPGNLYPSNGFTTAWQVNSGAYVTGALTASAGITFGNNKSDFLAAMVIGQNAIAGVNLDSSGKAISGGGSALRMGAFHQLEWWTHPFTTASFIITSQQLTASNIQTIVASDTGILFGGSANSGLAFQSIYPGGVTGTWLTLAPGYGANPPTLGLAGGVANQNLRLQAKGTGTISFGTYTAGAVSQTGYITIADEGGTPRRLLVG